MHLELVSCTATAAATTGAAAAALAGDSLIVKNANRNKRVDIVAAWGTLQAAGFAQIAFPSAHDTTRGFRVGVPIGVMPFLFAPGCPMQVQPQETLAVTLGEAATAGDVAQCSMLLRYEDLPGVNARLITHSQLMQRMELLTTVENSLASTAGPSYGTPELLTADSDLLKANRDYAVLGFTSRTAVNSIYLLGPDFGNVRIASPGVLRAEITAGWFPMLSRMYGEPLIPILNSGNKASTYIGVTTDENAGTFVVTAHLALLK